MLSLIVPAHNEAALLGRTLEALHAAARSCGVPYELVVADDASTDDTAAVATRLGARVVRCEARQIAAARNAGARAARGDALVFVDADTLVPPATLAAALAALEAGAVGGGARVRFDDDAPWAAGLAARAVSRAMALCRWATGCFVFARRDAFEAAGGFDERYFVSEEIHVSRSLKRLGRFAVVKPPCITSSRKLRLYGTLEHLRQMAAVALLGPLGALRRRDRLFVWYDVRREPPGEGGAAGAPPR